MKDRTWFGELPPDWTIQPVKYFAEKIDGGSWGMDPQNDANDCVCIRVADFDFDKRTIDTSRTLTMRNYPPDVLNKLMLKPGDIIIEKSGGGEKTPVGRAVIFTETFPALFANFAERMRVKHSYDYRYIEYCLVAFYNIGGSYNYFNQTTGIQNLNIQKFRNDLFLPFPALVMQSTIADYLDKQSAAIDATISLHQQIIEKLEEYRKSVITQAVTKGLNPNVEMAMTGNNRLPIIPKEWKLIRLPHIVDTRHPYALGDGDHGIIKTDMYKNHGIPYIRVQNLGWGTPLSIDNVVYISENDNMKIVNSTLQPNDVLFAKTGATIGKTAIVPETIPMSNTTSHVGKITVSPRYNPKYIFYVLSSEYGYHQMWIYASQKATRPELSLDDIKNFVLPIPKERQEQNNIVQYLDNVCEKILESIAQHKVIIEKLQEYKQSLIYNAVTGKIDCRTEGGEVQ